MANQRRDAAIVGIYEWPKRVDPSVSAMQMKAASIKAALDDAGLKWSDVDAIYDAGDGDGGGGGLGLAAYLGLKPTVIDTTQVGGSSYEFHAAHALRDIAAGKAKVAVLSYGSKSATRRVPIGTGGGAGGGTWSGNMESPYGTTLIANYAMVANRHMHDYGTTSEQLAHISVATRHHAMRNPEAVQAMTDLQFVGVNEITVDDVMSSRVIADPLHLLECCMVSDGGGAVIIASADVARNTKKKPVWIIGSGEATKYRENGSDITTSAGAQSAPLAFGEAQVSPSEIDIAMIYDSFTITAAITAEMLGLTARGEGPSLWADGNASPGGKFPVNTNGGGLSFNHSGMYGMQLLIESYRQLSGTAEDGINGIAGKQTNAKSLVVNGTGGSLSNTGTLVLVAD